MRFPALQTLLLFCFAVSASCVRAQVADAPPAKSGASPGNAGPPGAAQQPGFTLHTSTRIVLTDVTVTDRNGNPVHGLPRSAFQILDDGKPQQLASFEEHSGVGASASAEAPSAPGVFSNSFLLHPPPAFTALLLDTTNLNIFDQMYLNQQMDKFVKALPPGESVAIFLRAGEFTVQLQSYTADHALLLAAMHKGIPRLPVPGARYASDYDTLMQMITFLQPLPGRKNLLWFSGGSNLDLRQDGGLLPVQNLRPVYDEMEANRIAVFPVDARGLTVAESPAMPWQQMLMTEIADATGGQAFFNTNGLMQAAAHVVDSGTSFYTLTYSPHDLKLDNKWHKVKVQVSDGAYTLSYRRGYYDDGRNLAPTSHQSRTLLQADGQTRTLPGSSGEPIIFTATVELASGSAPDAGAVPIALSSAPPKRGEIPYAIRYTLPAASLSLQQADGKTQVQLGTGVIAFNQLGRPLAHVALGFTIGINEEKLRENPGGVVDFSQVINLPKGEDYLFIAVWDSATRRVGTLQVPLQVKR